MRDKEYYQVMNAHYIRMAAYCGFIGKNLFEIVPVLDEKIFEQSFNDTETMDSFLYHDTVIDTVMIDAVLNMTGCLDSSVH